MGENQKKVRNYCYFWIAAATISGSQITNVLSTLEEAQDFVASIDTGAGDSLTYGPIKVWFIMDKRIVAFWLNQTLGNELFEPQNSPGIDKYGWWMESPRNSGKFTTAFGDVVHFNDRGVED